MNLIMIIIQFGKNLKTLRLSKGLTQKELAEQVGLDQRSISVWERELSIPNVETIAKLCEIFNETFDSILT